MTTLDRLFTTAAKRRPDSAAVREGPHHLTYGRADTRSSQLATALLRTGVQLGDPVVVQCADHRQELVAHLAVLKAGGVCVPVPRDVPARQARVIAAVSGAGTVLCSLSTRERWGGHLRLMALDDERLWKRVGALREDRALPRSSPTEAAYLLMTEEAGSWQAGHLVDHQAWQHAMEARTAQAGSAGRTVSLTGPPAGISALSALWWAVASGAVLDTQPSPESMGAGTVVCGPGEYARLLDGLAGRERMPRPRMVLLVGAPCPPALVARHFETLPMSRLRAEFAPAGSVLPWAVREFPPGEGARPPRGSVVAPAPGVRLRVLDVLGRTLGTGRTGEVCAVAGPLPFEVIGHSAVADAPAPLRSGVTGRWRQDGTLELTGRRRGGASTVIPRAAARRGEPAPAAVPATLALG